MLQAKLHALRVQPAQPGAQQRRGLHRNRKHPPAGADKGPLSEIIGPGAQLLRPERLDRRGQPRLRRAVARQKVRLSFAVGEIEAAAPGQQKLPRWRAHAVEHGDAQAAARKLLGRHQPSRAGADHGGVDVENVSHDGCLR